MDARDHLDAQGVVGIVLVDQGKEVGGYGNGQYPLEGSKGSLFVGEAKMCFQLG